MLQETKPPVDLGTSTPTVSKCAVLIPTLNAGRQWDSLRSGLLRQKIDPAQVLIVDSSSTDGTRTLAEKAGFQIITIPAADFRHSQTRQLAARMMPDAEFLVYMTQDATLEAEHTLSRLLACFADSSVGAAYGRQHPRGQANAIERHARYFNYSEDSCLRTFDSRHTIGFRSAYFSNSFAAYRRVAFDQVGGFPVHVSVSEDVSVAARMLLAGWRVAYCAEARVIHSHDLSLLTEFSRYFDIAVHHRQESWIIEEFGAVGGEGLRFVQSELRYLAKHAPLLIPLALIRSAAKWTAYRCGYNEHLLPLRIKKAMSAHPEHWSHDAMSISIPSRGMQIRKFLRR